MSTDYENPNLDHSVQIDPSRQAKIYETRKDKITREKIETALDATITLLESERENNDGSPVTLTDQKVGREKVSEKEDSVLLSDLRGGSKLDGYINANNKDRSQRQAKISKYLTRYDRYLNRREGELEQIHHLFQDIDAIDQAVVDGDVAEEDAAYDKFIQLQGVLAEPYITEVYGKNETENTAVILNFIDFYTSRLITAGATAEELEGLNKNAETIIMAAEGDIERTREFWRTRRNGFIRVYDSEVLPSQAANPSDRAKADYEDNL